MFRLKYVTALMSMLLCSTALDAKATNDVQHITDDTSISDLFALSPEKLINIKVTSVSKKEESAFEAPSAIHVITREDIRRLGVTSIPEALRSVPGIYVGHIDANKWVVSSRGFSGQFSNKLLVLIDGRSVYTPLFSGVYWDTQNVLFEDIERIEIIRGPGAALWGANAVNGVINVITRKAEYTQGNYVSVGAGNEEQANVAARRGGRIGDDIYYRAYVSSFKHDASQKLDGSAANDDWYLTQGGFRVDWKKSYETEITFQGDIYTGNKDWEYSLPVPTAPFVFTDNFQEHLSGGNILTRINHIYGDNNHSSLQLYIDHTTRNSFALKQGVTSIDADFQHNILVDDTHDMVWGLGFRNVFYDLDDTTYIDYQSENASESLFSGFIQNKVPLIRDKWYLTVGSKVELNDHTHFEYQPNIRSSWLINDNHTLWGSVSRSVRTPSISEDEVSLVVGNLSPGFIRWEANKDIESEEKLSYELGYRTKAFDGLFFDVTAFLNYYNNLRTYELGNVFIDSSTELIPHPVLPMVFDNLGDGEVYGFEATSRWHVTKDWMINASYSYLNMNLHIDSDSNDILLENEEDVSPKNMFNIHSRLNLPNDIELDQAVYYVDSLSSGVKPYVRFDARVGWKPIEGIELSLVGRNLLDDSHQEYVSGLYSDSVEISRSVFASVKWRF